jgi:outer membrane protein OmpA-like peptidoglycan-associated protein
MQFLLKSKKKSYFFFIFCLFILSACARKPVSLEKQLEAQGVRIIHVGETITLVLSSDHLFSPDSANIQACQFKVLSQVAKYLRGYQKVSVIVSAYKNASGDEKHDRALTRQQAYNVVTYLWNRGVDARIMEGIGYGSKCLFSNQCAYNRRIEIKFHYIPDYFNEMRDVCE